MRKSSKKIRLVRETVLALERPTLARVVGEGSASCYGTQCISVCHCTTAPANTCVYNCLTTAPAVSCVNSCYPGC